MADSYTINLPAGDYGMIHNSSINITTGGTSIGGYYISDQGNYRTKEEFYMALAHQIQTAWMTMDPTKCLEMRNVITKEVREALEMELVVVDGPLGPVYRVKPEAFKRIADVIDLLVNRIILSHVQELLTMKAGELLKTSGLQKPSNPSDLPTPIAPDSQKDGTGFVWKIVAPQQQPSAPQHTYYYSMNSNGIGDTAVSSSQ